MFDVAPPRRYQRESRAGEVHRLTQMRVSLTRPAAAPVSSPGCHRVSLSVHIVMRQKGVCKKYIIHYETYFTHSYIDIVILWILA